MKLDNTLILFGLVVVTLIITALCLCSTQQRVKTEHMKSILELYNRSKPPYRRTENMTMIDDTRNTVADQIDNVSGMIGDFKVKVDGWSESVRPDPAA